MAAIPQAAPVSPTLEAVDAAIEAAQDAGARPYLGVSQIGHACDRALWYGLRWAEQRKLAAKSLRAIEDGHAGEALMAARLRMVPGVTLHTSDPGGAGQIAVEAVSGHVRGHLDGAILGVREAPKTWHVWEHKQVNEAKFRKLAKFVAELGEKAALAAWDPVYHGQALVYMSLTGMKRHFLTVGTPGGREYQAVRTEADGERAEALVARAERIVTADVPPLRLSEDPAWFECRYCAYHELCHGDAAPVASCRTCAHSTPVMGAGAWRCERHDARIPLDAQRAGCSDHRYIPVLLEKIGTPVDSDGDSVTYSTPDGGTFVNGQPPSGFASAEIRLCADKRALTAIPELQAWRTDLGARIAA